MAQGNGPIIRESMAYGVHGELFVMVHFPMPPLPQEWTESIEFLRQSKVSKWLVYAQSTTLTPAQRKELSDFYESFGAGFRTALLTDSRLTRGIITSLGWINKNHPVRTYPLDGRLPNRISG